MAWQIEFTSEATKLLSRLGSNASQQIIRFLRERVSGLTDPRAIGEPLKGSHFAGLWRYRSGDYRILCEIQDQKINILVVLVGKRSDVYRVR